MGWDFSLWMLLNKLLTNGYEKCPEKEAYIFFSRWWGSRVSYMFTVVPGLRRESLGNN